MIRYKIEKRRTAPDRPAEWAMTHPDTGDKLGRFFRKDDGTYGVRMWRGSGMVEVPERFLTLHQVRQFILEAHQPEE